MAEPARKIYDEDDEQPITRPDLRALEGGAEGGDGTRPNLHVLHGQPGEQEGEVPAQEVDRPDLQALEGGGETSAPMRGHLGAAGANKKSSDTLPTGSAKNNLNYTVSDKDNEGGGFLKGTKGIFSKVGSFAGKHKLIFFGAGVGAALMIPIILFLLSLLGALLIPHFAENMAAWQFAKVTRANEESTKAVFDENGAINSASDKDFLGMKAKYQNLRSNTWGRLDKFRLNKAVTNLEASGDITYNYTRSGILGRERLSSITYTTGLDKAGQTRTRTTIKLGKPGFFTSYIHPIQTLKDKADTYAQVFAATKDALKVANPDVPTVYLNAQSLNYLRKIGANIAGMKAKDYLGQDEEKKKVLVEKETYEQVNDKSAVGTSASDDVNNVEEQASAAMDECMQDDTCVKQIVDEGGGWPSKVTDLITKALTVDNLKALTKKVVGYANPIYNVAMPLCMIYDGSKPKPQTAKAQSHEVQRTAATVMAVADQQKRGVDSGNDYNADLASAMVWKLNGDDTSGGIQASIAIQRAGGQTVNTTGVMSTQGAALGNQATDSNIFSALGVPGAAKLASTADTFCPTVTNLWVGIGLGVVNIALQVFADFFTGGSASVAEAGGEAAAEAAATSIMKNMMTKVVDTFTTKAGLQSIGRFTVDNGKSLIAQGGLIAGATFLARIIVASDTGMVHNGLAVGPPFDNDADNGANQMGNNMVCSQFMGRPLTNAEAEESHKSDQQLIASRNAQQSPFQRYFALSNASSLASKVTDTAAVNLNHHTFLGMVNNLGRIFNPFSLMPKLFGSVNSTASAATGENTQDYGNVQCGWTNAEYALVHNNPSYNSPSENSYQLEQSGKEDEIDSKYGPCFTSEMAELVTDTSKLVRDKNGNIYTNKGDCSPQELGPNNPKYGDLVFRYRIAKNRENTLSMYEELQNAPSDANTAASGTQAMLTQPNPLGAKG